jgi:hypothetical protein
MAPIERRPSKESPRSLVLVKSGLLFMATSPDSEYGKPRLRREVKTLIKTLSKDRTPGWKESCIF